MSQPRFASATEYLAVAEMLEKTRADVAETGAILLTTYLSSRANPAHPSGTGNSWESLNEALSEVQKALAELHYSADLCRNFGATASAFQKLIEDETQRGNGVSRPDGIDSAQNHGSHTD